MAAWRLLDVAAVSISGAELLARFTRRGPAIVYRLLRCGFERRRDRPPDAGGSGSRVLGHDSALVTKRCHHRTQGPRWLARFGTDLSVGVGSAAIAESRLARHRFGRRVYVDAVGETATCDIGRNAHGKRAKSRRGCDIKSAPTLSTARIAAIFICPSVLPPIGEILQLYPPPRPAPVPVAISSSMYMTMRIP